MGVGMALIVSKETADKAIATLKDNGIDAYVIGEMVENKDTKIILE